MHLEGPPSSLVGGVGAADVAVRFRTTHRDRVAVRDVRGDEGVVASGAVDRTAARFAAGDPVNEPRRSVFIGQLDYDDDNPTLLRLAQFLQDERDHEKGQPKPRKDRVDQLWVTFTTVLDLVTELRARGSLRAPTMFSAVDDPTVSTVSR